MKRLAIIVVFLFTTSQARAEPMREFLMSCTYGVMAGTLVGAASLAFTQKPGDNLNSIARGASLGLYSGMILGAYVIWGLPSGAEGEEGTAPDGTPLQPPPGDSGSGDGSEEGVRMAPIIYPLLSANGIDGVGISFNVLRF